MLDGLVNSGIRKILHRIGRDWRRHRRLLGRRCRIWCSRRGPMDSGRSPAAGVLGYLQYDGGLLFNVTHRHVRNAHVRAGGLAHS